VDGMAFTLHKYEPYGGTRQKVRSHIPYREGVGWLGCLLGHHVLALKQGCLGKERRGYLLLRGTSFDNLIMRE
jgi:hypothetical protein